MNATISEIAGIAVAFIALAAISVAIVNGKDTASILGTMGDTFVASLQAATGQSVTTRGK